MKNIIYRSEKERTVIKAEEVNLCCAVADDLRTKIFQRTKSREDRRKRERKQEEDV